MTLHTYFAIKYTKIMFIVLFLLSILMIMIDLTEHSRRFSSVVDLYSIIHLTFLNAPKSIYEIIDLIMLIVSLVFFISIGKTSELIIVRGAGRSVYGAIFSPLTVSFIFGVLILAIFNPLVATSSKTYLNMKETYLKEKKPYFQLI